MYKVNNLSGKWQDYKYIVIRDCRDIGEGFWYYGAYNDIAAAQQAAVCISNGIIVKPQDIE